MCKERPHLNGIGYVYYYSRDELEPYRAGAMMRKLNVQSVRSWNHIHWVLEDAETVNRPVANQFHQMYSQMLKAGVTQLVGMNHYWFFPESMGISGECSVIPRRDSPEYIDFLDLYELSWRTMVKEFPEITDWETGNELNHSEFIKPPGTTGDIFTLNERADICTDLMFRSARAIHDINPKAGIIMPGMAPIGERGLGVFATNIEVEYSGMIDTLTRIYQNINSGKFGSDNPRDFFDAICWHPYYAKQDETGAWSWKVPDDEWVRINSSVYETAVKAGDEGVGCCLSEFGFNDFGSEEEDERLIPFIREGFRLIREKMPFVDTVHAYRFFDSMGYVTSDRDNYSFFTMKNGRLTGKKRAYTLQEQYGGTGSLAEDG